MGKTKERVKSLLKSVIWRLCGVVILVAVTFAYTRSWMQMGLITLVHHGAFLIIFYVHERIWAKIKIKDAWTRTLLKMFTYETFLGNVVLGIISYVITGSLKEMTLITMTYIAIKHLCYIENEFLWKRFWKET